MLSMDISHTHLNFYEFMRLFVSLTRYDLRLDFYRVELQLVDFYRVELQLRLALQNYS